MADIDNISASQPSLLPRIHNLRRLGTQNPPSHDWNAEFAIVKRTLKSALDEEDISALDSAVQDWKQLLDVVPDYLYKEMVLINPLATAVQEERRSIVEVFVKEYDMRLEPFHPCSCRCRLCIFLETDVHFLQLFTNFIFDALTSPIYIFCVQTDSVIDYCLSLMKNVNRYRNYLSSASRKSIKNNLESAMVMSLKTATNHREIRHMLSDHHDITDMEKVLGRVLKFADGRFKQVLSHSTSQSLLCEEWFSRDLKLNRWFRRIDSSYLTALLHSFFAYLFIVPMTIFVPTSRLVRYINTPYVKYQTEFASFWIFLAYAIVMTQYTHLNIRMVCQGRTKSPAMFSLTVFQSIFAALLILKIARYATLIYCNGKRMFVSGYDKLQFISVLFYAMACILININIYIVPHRKSIEGYCVTILSIPNITLVGDNCPVTRDLYIKHSYLPSWLAEIMQPYMIGSVMFAIGHLTYFISSGQCLYMIREMVIFTIAVQKMVVDCVKWGIFFLLFLLAWSVAAMVLYSGYRCGTSYFNGILAATQEIFWIMFAMTGTTDYKLTTAKHSIWSQDLVQYLGLLMYTAFFMVGTLILVNLLIALMAVTYENINDSANTEIAYWQSKVRIKHILWLDCLPLPFNALYPLYLLFALIWAAIGRKGKIRSFLSGIPEYTKLNEEELQFLQKKQKEIFYTSDFGTSEGMSETNSKELSYR